MNQQYVCLSVRNTGSYRREPDGGYKDDEVLENLSEEERLGLFNLEKSERASYQCL